MSCQQCHYITGHGPECRYFHEDAAADAAELRGRVDELERARVRGKVFVVHVYDAADRLHDYYVHQTAEGALRQASCDVTDGRFEDADFDFLEAERARVLRTVHTEPGVGRRHVRCDTWHAHVDEMQVLP